MDDTVTVQTQVDRPTQSASEATIPSQGPLQTTDNDVHMSREADIVPLRHSKAQFAAIMTMLYVKKQPPPWSAADFFN